MLIVLINGSAREGGNTAALLEEAAKIAEESGCECQTIHVASILKKVKDPFCSQCSVPCRGSCSQNNALGESFQLLRRADGIIMASPVYFGTVSGQLKAYWDKTRILRREEALLNVVGGAVAVGASRFGGQEQTLRALQEMMLVQGMTVVGDGFPGAGCGHHGVGAQQPAGEERSALKGARILTQRVIQVARATQELRQGRGKGADVWGN